MYQFCKSIKKYKKSFKPDYIIICGAYLYKYAKKTFNNIPIITDIVDLWPLSIVEYANVSKNNPLIRYLYYIEKNAYIKTNALVFSMEGGKDYIYEQKYSSKIKEEKVFHINMGIDIKQNDINLKKNVGEISLKSEDFNIGYCGSIRQANNIKQICDAAKEFKINGNDRIKFHIYGNGDQLDSLIRYCADNKIDNIRFYGRIEKEKIPFVLSSMDANILTYKQVGLMKYGGSQSKLFDYLAVGKPIICNAIFGYNLITRYDCGLVTENQEARSFFKCVEELYNMSLTRRKELGLNARKTAELYDVQNLTDKLEEVFAYIGKESGENNA